MKNETDPRIFKARSLISALREQGGKCDSAIIAERLEHILGLQPQPENVASVGNVNRLLGLPPELQEGAYMFDESVFARLLNEIAVYRRPRPLWQWGLSLMALTFAAVLSYLQDIPSLAVLCSVVLGVLITLGATEPQRNLQPVATALQDALKDVVRETGADGMRALRTHSFLKGRAAK